MALGATEVGRAFQRAVGGDGVGFPASGVLRMG